MKQSQPLRCPCDALAMPLQYPCDALAMPLRCPCDCFASLAMTVNIFVLLFIRSPQSTPVAPLRETPDALYETLRVACFDSGVRGLAHSVAMPLALAKPSRREASSREGFTLR
ncbi:hypothetical protein LC586_33025 [Nostoc sp. CHAB 5714]|uniref:Uncharacterized protein n=1 Tax=Nostoc favosum CHAB5714 TaxID=2780399 RepID=A0ABS8IIV2_9NOSO|nr:hypothetical protein [Nostoc favosum CHAB5714]